MATSTTYKMRTLVGDGTAAEADSAGAEHSGADGHGDAHGGGGHAAHAVPPYMLLGVFGALLVLTGVTVGVTFFDFGPANIWVALGIAVVKAALVALYFMHLRWDSPFNSVVFIAAMFFVALFIGIAIMDTHEYQVNFTAPANTASPR